MTRARVMEGEIVVRGGLGANAVPVDRLAPGQEIVLGEAVTLEGETWVEVFPAAGASSLPDAAFRTADGAVYTGRPGYIPGTSRVLKFKRAELLQSVAELYARPPEGYATDALARMSRGETFDIVDSVLHDGRKWVKVRDRHGREGFIDGGTRIKVLPVATRAGARTAMKQGLVWCAGAALVTLGTLEPALHGLNLALAAGALVLGATHIGRGVEQYVRSRRTRRPVW